MQLVHVGHRLDRRDQDGFSSEGAVGATAPGLRVADDRHVGRLHHRAAVPGQLPARDRGTARAPAPTAAAIHASVGVRSVAIRRVSLAGGRLCGELLQVDVAQPPFLQLAHGPISGCAKLRGVRQARTVAVRQVIERLHDRRTRGPPATAPAATSTAAATTDFGRLNLVNDVEVDALGLLLSDDQQGNEQRK